MVYFVLKIYNTELVSNISNSFWKPTNSFLIPLWGVMIIDLTSDFKLLGSIPGREWYLKICYFPIINLVAIKVENNFSGFPVKPVQ